MVLNIGRIVWTVSRNRPMSIEVKKKGVKTL